MKIYCIAAFVSTLLLFQSSDAAPKDTSTISEVVSQDEITSDTVCTMMKNYGQVNSILATISRHPQSVASEIESRLSQVGENTSSENVKVFVGYAQTILKNRKGLKTFDFLERVGIPRFEEMVCAKPDLFAPLFNSFERVMEHTTKDMAPTESRLSPRNLEVESPNETEQPSQTPLAKFKQLVEVNTVLAKVARTSPEAIAEVDAGLVHLQETYPESTAFGKSLGRMRILLKNRRSLAWFDFLDRAGLGKLEKLILSKPAMFEERNSADEESTKQN